MSSTTLMPLPMSGFTSTGVLLPPPTLMSSSGYSDCTSGLKRLDPEIHKRTYYVGVHAPGGIDTAWREYNRTFEAYLTATAGQRFVPPVEFKMKTTTAPIKDWVDREEDVDFTYSDTGVYSCIGVEMGLEPLATTVSEWKVRGQEYDLDMFGGVIFTRADNDYINSFADLKDKVIGALAISDFAGAQVQFYAMHMANMDYIMDPKQVIFTDNQIEIVRGVLRGDWEVGFVRTGMIERTLDDNGQPIDPEMFKVLEPKIFVLDNGDLFPFLHSTPVFGEWPVAAMTTTPRDIVEAVQDALIKLNEHKLVGKKINECRHGTKCGFEDCPRQYSLETCETAPPTFFYPDARCDTTRELAELAFAAATAGHHSGFRPPKSYFNLRTMQEEAGFLVKDQKSHWECTRTANLYDGLICPTGHYKVNREEFQQACDNIGAPCPEGYDCYCKPCVEAFEVDVYHWEDMEQYDHILQRRDNNNNDDDDTVDEEYYTNQKGCNKMSFCGTVQQTQTIIFRAKDNKERPEAIVKAIMHVDADPHELVVTQVLGEKWVYEFNFTDHRVGVGILEVYVNNEQIPESPFRVQIAPRNCEEDFPGRKMSPTFDGVCECRPGTITIFGECLDNAVIASIIAGVVLVIALKVVYLIMRQKRKKSDEMWHVNIEELHFDDTVSIIGQGAFGVVLLAEYRGTKVAIKRAVRPDKKNNRNNNNNNNNNGSKEQQQHIVDGKGGSFIVANDDEDSMDIETPAVSKRTTYGIDSNPDSTVEVSFIADDIIGGLKKGGMWRKICCCPVLLFGKKKKSQIREHILGSSQQSGRSSMTNALFPCCDSASRQKKAFLEEMRLLSRLRHPCITTVMGAVVASGQDPMLVMEYMEYGSLYDLIHSESMFFSGEILLQISRDVAQGLRYLHASKPPILHGDLKSKNILIDSRFRAKVCDFGLSTKKKNGISGTPFWLAPEYLRGKTDYTPACDLYSVGIIFFEIYSRSSPYKGEDFKSVLRKVCDPRRNYRPKIPDCCPPKISAIMKKLWAPDPAFRPLAKDLDAALLDMNGHDVEPLTLCGSGKEEQSGMSREAFYDQLPKHIARALNHGQKIEPEKHEEVTVVFVEIDRFEDIVMRSEPSKVTDLLERVHPVLDALAKKHDIFKVQTVGECFMAVANIEGNQSTTHVKTVAEFAMEAIHAAHDIMIDEAEPKYGHLRLRVGFHSGPVVSNVIGNTYPRYCFFGDTVTTASRMESNSMPNRIHCSYTSARILKDQDSEIQIIKRGKINVKGKGQMTTYWIGDPVSPGNKDDRLYESGSKSVTFSEGAFLESHSAHGDAFGSSTRKLLNGGF